MVRTTERRASVGYMSAIVGGQLAVIYTGNMMAVHNFAVSWQQRFITLPSMINCTRGSAVERSLWPAFFRRPALDL